MIEILNKILNDEKLGQLIPAQAFIIPHSFSVMETDKLNKLIEDFQPQEGWLCLTNIVVRIPHDGALPLTGIVLSGELVAGLRSLHIRQDESGWLCRIIERKNTVGDQLMYEQSFLPIPGRGSRRLKYEVYWRETADPSGRAVYRPYISRFAGYETTATKTMEV
ncbi:MAG: hypothetical protein JW943_10515 [Deltaproteobacteria bacterium]|nr:hypothetical protein [Deltaproteobacteria bacterium]